MPIRPYMMLICRMACFLRRNGSRYRSWCVWTESTWRRMRPSGWYSVTSWESLCIFNRMPGFPRDRQLPGFRMLKKRIWRNWIWGYTMNGSISGRKEQWYSEDGVCRRFLIWKIVRSLRQAAQREGYFGRRFTVCCRMIYTRKNRNGNWRSMIEFWEWWWKGPSMICSQRMFLRKS